MDDLLVLGGTAIVLCIPILFWGGLVTGVRHGPVRSRFWRGETVLGVTSATGVASLLAGLVGPMVVVPESNLGPLIGLLYTGPAGVVIGLLWGLWRRRQRGG